LFLSATACNASYVLDIVQACVYMRICHTLEPYQNGAS